MTDDPAIIHGPGWHVARELEARGWSQRDLAAVLGRPAQAVNEIVNGTKQVTAETAVQLSQAFTGTSPEFWANLESTYRVRLAKRGARNSDVDQRSRIYQAAPVSELLRRGWLPDAGGTDELETAVCRFLGVSHLGDEPAVAAMSLRHTDSRAPEPRAKIAWARRVQLLAEPQTLPMFASRRFGAWVPTLFDLAREASGVAQVPKLLNDKGVHFVFVPHLQGTYLDGAAITPGARPIVALTLRYDRIDNFWFTLGHELAHLALGHPGVLDDPPDRRPAARDPNETAADSVARDWLLDPSVYAAFRRETAPRPSRRQIEAFADRVGRHPSIVVGRLQHDQVITFAQHRWAHDTVRHHLSAWNDRIPAVSSRAG